MSLGKVLANFNISVEWMEPLEKTFNLFNLNTTLRQAAFLGQTMYESGYYKKLEENLNYSAERILQIWPKRFKTLEAARICANSPEKLANEVYGNRATLGNITKEDGWRYHGRGLIQLTGRFNYARCGVALDLDLETTPELLLQPSYAALSAGWFWDIKALNEYADSQSYNTLTQKINGGYHAVAARKELMQSILTMLEPTSL